MPFLIMRLMIILYAILEPSSVTDGNRSRNQQLNTEPNSWNPVAEREE